MTRRRMQELLVNFIDGPLIAALDLIKKWLEVYAVNFIRRPYDIFPRRRCD